MNDAHKFLTHEIGSLAKPPWLVKTSAGRALESSDVEHAKTWGEKLDVDGHEELVQLLEAGAEERVHEVANWASRYALRLQEKAGLDWVYDGEQQRTEMYAWAVAHANGFESRGTVRSFDNKYYNKSAVTGPISLAEPYHNEEFELLKSAAQHKLKIPVTGAYTLAIWSYDEFYGPSRGQRLGAGESRSATIEARREFALDLARNLIRPNLQALIDLGAEWIQIDEPGASTEADELELFAESFNVSVEGLDCTFSTHLCFSDYDLFFPAIEAMSGCRQFCVGFANYDSRDLGTKAEDRPGYEVISKFRDLPYEPALGLGVLDIHTDFIESPELVRDRILYAVDVFGDPARIHICPDCGLRTRSWDVAYEKLVRMVEGTKLAEDALTESLAHTS